MTPEIYMTIGILTAVLSLFPAGFGIGMMCRSRWLKKIIDERIKLHEQLDEICNGEEVIE